MPRPNSKLVKAAARAAEAKRIVAGQRLIVETLKAQGRPADEAEALLETLASALKVLEGHERKLREARRAKTRETKK
jgi:hypothetical protein